MQLDTFSPLTRLVLIMVGVSILALGAAVLFTTVENMQDPDRDGIATRDDPSPFVFNGDLDADGDGWTNGYERMMGTELTDPDQDGDGLTDGLDPDGDGMSSWFERNVARLDPGQPNQRYYVQLMSTPFSTVNETENRRFWVEGERIRPEHYIVEYSVTLQRFQEIIEQLSREVTDQDFIYLYLRTHGEQEGSEPILCFADEAAPDRADRCGKIITYRELGGLLDRIPCRAMVMVYSSCAGSSAVEVLAKGRYPRAVAAVMGLTAGIPSVDAPSVARGTATGYFSADDLIQLITTQSTAACSVEERVSDTHNVSTGFYYGEYPKIQYQGELMDLREPDEGEEDEPEQEFG